MTSSPRKYREYAGSDIVVRYDARRCIHFARCVHGLPQVFDSKARPWIKPDEASADQVAEAVMTCPTGALTYERSDGGKSDSHVGRARALVSKDGPILLAGNLTIEAPALDDPQAETRVALCRCGSSENKPFCDGRHEAAGFTDPGVLPERENQSGEEGQAVVIRVQSNGPVLFEGTLDIMSDDLEQSITMQKGALCRCGASKTKPFCDGSHRAVDLSD